MKIEERSLVAKALARDDNEKVEADSKATATARQRLPPFAENAKGGAPGNSKDRVEASREQRAQVGNSKAFEADPSLRSG